MAAAKAYIAPFVQLPNSINITAPLSGKPPAGKKVFLITSSDPSTQRIGDGLKAATETLGWTLTVLRYSTNPADANGDMIQALQQGADYIVYVAVTKSIVQPAIDAAKVKGIPVFESFGVTPPEGDANWLFSNVGGGDAFATKGKLNADYIIANSSGTANTLLVTVPAFDVLKIQSDAAAAEFKENCPTCPFHVLNAAYADVAGGKLPAQVVNYLRSHPKVDNVLFAAGGFTYGFTAAAKAAGIKLGPGGVTVTEADPSSSNLDDILKGNEQMTVSGPNNYDGWLIADAIARKTLNMNLKPNWDTVIPYFVQTKENTTSTTVFYEGPTDYQTQFKKLWHLS